MAGIMQRIRDFTNERVQQWDNALRDAPPKNRHFYCTYVPLWKRPENGQEEPTYFGIFVPEFYILAKNGQLREQREGNADGKTAFELACLWVPHFDDARDIVQTEYEYQQINGYALPTPVSKVRVVPDYLSELVEGPDAPFMLASQHPTLSERAKANAAVNDFVATVHNAPSHTKFTERFMHWLGQQTAIVAGVVAIAAILPLTTPLTLTASLALLPLYALGLWAATTAAKSFSTYDTAEWFHREIPWVTSAAARNGKFSRNNAFDAALKIGAIMAAAVTASTGAFASVIALSAVLPAVMSPLVTVTAALLAAAAMGATYTGLFYAVRYLTGISPYDNKIQPQEVHSFLRKLNAKAKQAPALRDEHDALPKPNPQFAPAAAAAAAAAADPYGPMPTGSEAAALERDAKKKKDGARQRRVA